MPLSLDSLVNFCLCGPLKLKRSQLSQPWMRRFTKSHEVSRSLLVSPDKPWNITSSSECQPTLATWQFWKHRTKRTTPDHPYQNAQPRQTRQRVISVASCVENVLCHKTQRMAMAKSSQYSPYLTLLQSFSVLSHLQTSTVQYCPRDLVAPILVDVHIAGVWKVVLICEPSTLFFRAGSSSSPIFNEKREGGRERARERERALIKVESLLKERSVPL